MCSELCLLCSWISVVCCSCVVCILIYIHSTSLFQIMYIQRKYMSNMQQQGIFQIHHAYCKHMTLQVGCKSYKQLEKVNVQTVMKNIMYIVHMNKTNISVKYLQVAVTPSFIYCLVTVINKTTTPSSLTPPLHLLTFLKQYTSQCLNSPLTICSQHT